MIGYDLYFSSENKQLLSELQPTISFYEKADQKKNLNELCIKADSHAKFSSITYRGTFYSGVWTLPSIKDYKIHIGVRHSHHYIGTTF